MAGLDSAVILDWCLSELANDPRRATYVSTVTRVDPLPKNTNIVTLPGMIVNLQGVAAPIEPVGDHDKPSTFSAVVVQVRAIGQGNSDVKLKAAIRWAIRVLDNRNYVNTPDGSIIGCRKGTDPLIPPTVDGDVTYRYLSTTFRIWGRDTAYLDI